jgi:hypothetical protein
LPIPSFIYLRIRGSFVLRFDLFLFVGRST